MSGRSKSCLLRPVIAPNEVYPFGGGKRMFLTAGVMNSWVYTRGDGRPVDPEVCDAKASSCLAVLKSLMYGQCSHVLVTSSSRGGMVKMLMSFFNWISETPGGVGALITNFLHLKSLSRLT